VAETLAVAFEYVGRTALSVRGSITGRSYRFAAPGAVVAVDARDAGSVAAVPLLRRCGAARAGVRSPLDAT
jgi:hypothetical protein